MEKKPEYSWCCVAHIAVACCDNSPAAAEQCHVSPNKPVLLKATRLKIKGNYYYYIRFVTLCLGLPRWVSAGRINHSGFSWSRHDGVAVASAEQYASYLHFAPGDNHTSISSVRFLPAGCPSCRPTNSVKALKAVKKLRRNGYVDAVIEITQCFVPELLSLSQSDMAHVNKESHNFTCYPRI